MDVIKVMKMNVVMQRKTALLSDFSKLGVGIRQINLFIFVLLIFLMPPSLGNNFLVIKNIS
jgi:hypothetical protein